MSRTAAQQSAIDVVNGWARRLVTPPPPNRPTRQQASKELLDKVAFLEQQWPVETSSPSSYPALTWPIEGRDASADQLSSGGWSNDHLARGEKEALDIAVPIGTILVFPHNGHVSQSGGLGTAGYAVTEEWDEEGHHYLCRLCHLREDPEWPSGTVVDAGEMAAYSGNSGLSTGPHCHVFLERDGQRVRLEDVYGFS